MSENTTEGRVVKGLELLAGPLLGGLTGVLLTLDNLVSALLDDRIQGVQSQSLHRFLATEFRPEVVRATLLLFALSLLIGTFLGLVVTGVSAARVRWLNLPSPSRLRRLGEGFGGIVFGFGWVYLHDVASRPALHQSAWFERGGVRKGIQILVADGLGGPGVLALGSVLVLGYFLLPVWRHPERRTKLKEFGFASLVMAALVSAITVWPSNLLGIPAVHASSGARPNVLIIAADSLRPDRIDERRAPNLTAFAKHATRFEQALTPLARTFPAWVSILTGQYPHHHGIRHMFPRWETRDRPFETVATRFASEGYKTAVVGDFAADIFRRVDLGFQTVNTPTFTLRELVREHLFKNDPWLLAWLRGKVARTLVPSIVEIHDATCPWSVTEDAIAELGTGSGQPFFLTVFYSTTHFPYATPSPYHKEFRATAYDGPFRYAKADDLSLDGIREPADIAQIRALYDGAVSATDDAIGKLLRELSKRGLAENTLVVITADHGEQLYEYGRSQGHGDNLEGDEALRVPLIVFDPRIAAAHQESNSVSLVDLAPTLLDLAGLEPLSSADGRTLAAAVRGQPIAPKYIYGETGLWFTELIAEVPLSRRLPYPDLTRISEVDRAHGDQIVLRQPIETFAVAAKHRMLEWNNYRLLYLPTREGPKFELYDRSTDPGFTRDVAARYPAVVAKLKPALLAWFDEDPMVEREGETLWPQ